MTKLESGLEGIVFSSSAFDDDEMTLPFELSFKETASVFKETELDFGETCTAAVFDFDTESDLEERAFEIGSDTEPGLEERALETRSDTEPGLEETAFKTGSELELFTFVFVL
jgi:hypothetical protein